MYIYNIAVAKLIKSKVILIQEYKIKNIFGMINYQAKFFKLTGSFHNGIKIYKIEFLYAFSLNKMKAVIIPKSIQKINVKLLHVTCFGDSLKLSNLF